MGESLNPHVLYNTGPRLMGRDLLQKYGVRIRFIGRRDMLPPDVRGAVEDMERLTERHSR
jgi:undecaprenyl pyrophosphate synthase